MEKISLVLLFTICFSQSEEWIYYNESSGVYRTKPDNSERELFMDSLSVLDVSENEQNFLYGKGSNIFLISPNTVDTLILENIIYYARFTQNENEIVYYQPSWGYSDSDKIYKYSFLDDSKTLIADSLDRFINFWGIMSPQKNKIAYFKSDYTYISDYQLFVVDIGSGQTTFLTTINTSVNPYVPPSSYWAIDDYIYLNITNYTDYYHLYKVHSSNAEMPLIQLTEGETNFRLPYSYNSNLNKLILKSTNVADSLSDLWVYELETNQLSFIDTIQGEFLDRQTWSKDNLKVAIQLQLNLGPGEVLPIQIYDFVNDTITALSDSALPLFWLGGQELDIRDNFDYMPIDYFLKQNFPNPFNPITTLRYDLPENGLVNITIYDMLGNVISQLVNEVQNSGHKSIQWDATNNQGQPVSAGVYLYSIKAGDFRQTKKMILLK